MIDEFAAMALMVVPLVCTTFAVLDGLWHIVAGDLGAMSLEIFSNGIIEWAIVVVACLMWSTLCYWSEHVHRFWKIKVWPLPSLMPGGFVPRLAAFSLGMRMFVTSTLVSEGRVAGKDLMDKFEHDHWEYCRATDMEAGGADGVWFSRMLRRPPAIWEGFKCFNAHGATDTGFKWWTTIHPFGATPFDQSDLAEFLINSTVDMGVHIPYKNGSSMGTSAGFPMEIINHPLEALYIFNQTDFSQFTFHCMYQCVKWKTIGLMDLMKNVGTIVAGSAFVVTTTDRISKAFGGHWFKWCGLKGWKLGLPLVRSGATSDVILEIVKATRSHPGKGRSKLLAAFIIGLMAMCPLWCASKLDIDGFYTVDYYVTAVLLSSLFMACLLRQWNPYNLMRIAYTEDMWLHGSDKFIDKRLHGTYRNIDLYEWIHLDQKSRADHLIGHARIVTTEAIDKEMERQKVHDVVRDLEMSRKKESDESRTKFQAAQIVTCFADQDPNMMLNEFHNNNAALVVEVIKTISVITVSPPVTRSQAEDFKLDDGHNCPAGSILQKIVIISEGAVGTVVAKMDGGRIKVRFPKTEPKHAPKLRTKQDASRSVVQYTMEFQPKLKQGHESKASQWMMKAAWWLGPQAAADPSDDLDKFEDVVVPLEQVIEASQPWLEVGKVQKSFGSN